MAAGDPGAGGGGRRRLGEMLVAAGLLTPAQLSEALTEQARTGGRLGDVLLAKGLVNESQITQTLSNQLSIPWVSLYHVEFSRELLNLVGAEIAERYGLVPIYVREV